MRILKARPFELGVFVVSRFSKGVKADAGISLFWRGNESLFRGKGAHSCVIDRTLERQILISSRVDYPKLTR